MRRTWNPVIPLRHPCPTELTEQRLDTGQGGVKRIPNRSRDPNHADALNNLGILLGESGDLAASCDAFRRALRVTTEDPKLHYDLADTLDAMGLAVEAQQHWHVYLRSDPAGSPCARERLPATI